MIWYDIKEVRKKECQRSNDVREINVCLTSNLNLVIIIPSEKYRKTQNELVY